MHQRRAKKLEVVFEFLVFGIVVGIIEDAIAILFVTGEPLTWRIIGIVVLVTIPFAIIGELIADNIDFSKLIQKLTDRMSGRP